MSKESFTGTAAETGTLSTTIDRATSSAPASSTMLAARPIPLSRNARLWLWANAIPPTSSASATQPAQVAIPSSSW